LFFLSPFLSFSLCFRCLILSIFERYNRENQQKRDNNLVLWWGTQWYGAFHQMYQIHPFSSYPTLPQNEDRFFRFVAYNQNKALWH
jgi:hypothetical protein